MDDQRVVLHLLEPSLRIRAEHKRLQPLFDAFDFRGTIVDCASKNILRDVVLSTVSGTR